MTTRSASNNTFVTEERSNLAAFITPVLSVKIVIDLNRCTPGGTCMTLESEGSWRGRWEERKVPQVRVGQEDV